VNTTASQDQRFFDIFILVIGILVFITFALFLLARYVGGQTQEAWALIEDNYQDEVRERIAPIGLVAVEGQALPDTGEPAQPEALPSAAPVAVAMTGPQVYNAACLACHGAGIGGAPKTGDVGAWAPRIAQGEDTLTEHVINGYQGEAGYMPPKGGRVDLSDDEILAAMYYMLEESS
jgi:cytochrome c5